MRDKRKNTSHKRKYTQEKARNSNDLQDYKYQPSDQLWTGYIWKTKQNRCFNKWRHPWDDCTLLRVLLFGLEISISYLWRRVHQSEMNLFLDLLSPFLVFEPPPEINDIVDLTPEGIRENFSKLQELMKQYVR
ncbi:hypothetical protein E3N88_15475 [Mikania micrantha]|uniref:Uncharacterized protein n=1 Tax=Mikania micrantha TaxID=192012 RepID=A0A5N6NYR1_9ASTR|nr:hypothetical protein E3N88_15475 [Mikania micrantha]